MSRYENHLFRNELPIIFHYDHVDKEGKGCLSNWHENIEFLYCTVGEGRAIINSKPVEMKPGSLIVINSGDIHYTVSDTKEIEYYCLIVYTDFLKEFGIDAENIHFTEDVTDSSGCDLFQKIVIELDNRLPYYTAMVRGEIISFVAYLCRNYISEKQSSGNDDMIKSGMLYIREHFQESINVESVASHAGFSRFYFSRQFKSITGMTVMEYVQFLRCRHARELLLSGNCSVSKAAMESGFSDLSYFTKVFKGQFGVLPSEVARMKVAHTIRTDL